MRAMSATFMRSFIASTVSTFPDGPVSGLQSSSTSCAVMFSIFWQSLAAAWIYVIGIVVLMQRSAKTVFIILEYLKGRNDFYHRIGKKGNDDPYCRIDNCFPGFLEFRCISFSSEKLICCIERSSDDHDGKDSPEKGIFDKGKYWIDISKVWCRSIITSYSKISDRYSKDWKKSGETIQCEYVLENV